MQNYKIHPTTPNTCTKVKDGDAKCIKSVIYQIMTGRNTARDMCGVFRNFAARKQQAS